MWTVCDFVPRSKALGIYLEGKGCGATKPICGPILILSSAQKSRGPPYGGGYVATKPIPRPLLILSPPVKRWGAPKRLGLCSHLTCDPLLILSPALKLWAPPKR